MTKATDRELAQLGSLSRTAACLINEGLVEATFSGKTITIWHSGSKGEKVIFQLKNAPFKSGYIYPLDFTREVTHSGGEVVADGADLMRLFGRWTGVEVDRVCREFTNCADNQTRSYQRPRGHLSIDSPIIDWEQAVIEGHSIHPWHKCRFPLVGDFTDATVHFVIVDRQAINVVGEYDHWMQNVICPGVSVKDDQIIFPVHELQLPKVQQILPNVQILPQTLPGQAQSSLRTINLPTTSSEICIKIPLSLKVTSIVRTIRPWAITIGHRLEPVLQILEQASQTFGGSLIAMREYGAASSQSEHLGCIIRESTESIAARTGDRIIVCAALTENITAIWDPAQMEENDRASVLREYCYHLFRAVLAPVLLHGFALQGHQQNLLIRLDPVTKQIKGFVARDFGSFRVHSDTFRQTAGLEVDTAWVLTSMDSLEKVYGYILTVVHGHVVRMTRALKLGMAGWKIAREELEKITPEKNELARRLWLESETRVARAHISMQLHGVKTECTNINAPNMFWHAQYC